MVPEIKKIVLKPLLLLLLTNDRWCVRCGRARQFISQASGRGNDSAEPGMFPICCCVTSLRTVCTEAAQRCLDEIYFQQFQICLIKIKFCLYFEFTKSTNKPQLIKTWLIYRDSSSCIFKYSFLNTVVYRPIQATDMVWMSVACAEH